jgi:hypothetical protein
MAINKIATQAINTLARVIFDAKLSGFVYSIGKRQDLTSYFAVLPYYEKLKL